MKQRITIPRRVALLALFSAGVTATVLDHAIDVPVAKARRGFESRKLAVGQFGEIGVFNVFLMPNQSPVKHAGYKSDIWLSSQKTNGPSDLYVQSNVFQPGGSTGWHTHSGHSLVIVTQGTITGYDAHDPDCKPHIYVLGMGFVDAGGDHVHLLRNEGDVVARTIAVQLIPAAAARWIDVADPGNCHF